MRSRQLSLLGILFAWAAPACGPTDYPAPHAAPPQVIDRGGPVLASPKIVPVFFSQDDAELKGRVGGWLAGFGATSYWTAVTKDYGVGASTASELVELTESVAATIDESEIASWLQGKLNSDDPAFPAPDADTLYVVFYPAGVTVTRRGTLQSCVDFGGFHTHVTLDEAHGGGEVAYAVVPRCGEFGGLSGIDVVTAAAAHEILEAVTDPFLLLSPAWAGVDDAHYYWSLVLGGGEIADLCVKQPDDFIDLAGVVVPRVWSNSAASASHHPCVPAPAGEVYFNAAPVLDDALTFQLGGGESVTMKGVKIPVGQSDTIALELFSDGDTGGPWTVEAKDDAELRGEPPALELSLDRDAGQNGDTLQLTIRVLEGNPYNAEVFFVLSTLGQRQNHWIGLVGN